MCPFLLVDRLGNSKGFNSDRVTIHKVPSKPARAHFAGRFIDGEMRSFATSGAEQGGRKSCALRAGEVAEPCRWLCSTGYMLKLFHSSSLPCFSEVLWRPTVRRCALKKMLASHGCVGLCVPLWAKAHCTVCFPSLIDEY